MRLAKIALLSIAAAVAAGTVVLDELPDLEVVIPAAPTSVAADTVVLYETDFTSLPPGWTYSPGSGCWSFGPDGATMHLYGSEFSSVSGWLKKSNLAYVPDAVSEIRITVSQDLYLHHLGIAGAYVRLEVSYDNGATWLIVYTRSADYETTEPIDVAIFGWEPGGPIGVKFYGEASGGYMGQGQIDWTFNDFALMGYGEVATPSDTWGDIKALMQWQ